MIPYSRQFIDEEDIGAVVEVLRSNWLTTGPKVKEFEKAFSEKVGARYAVACSSGTAGLHLACLAGGVSNKSTLVTSPITFLASANCGKFVGADILFIDVERETICFNPDELRKLSFGLENLCLLPVHYAGIPCNMDSISDWGRGNKCLIIEDACHALGASYVSNGEEMKIGSCGHSDMCVFSFHPVKHMTTGEGGMVTTNSEELFQKLVLYRNHGKEENPKFFKNPDLAFAGDRSNKNPWYYEMQHLGYNYRMTDFQAALGLSQLKKIDWFVERRCEIADYYRESFKKCEFIKLIEVKNSNVKPSWHLYPLQIDFQALGKTRNHVFDIYKKNHIEVQVHYVPLHYQPFYADASHDKLPMAEKYYESCISIPIFPALAREEQDKIIDVTLNQVIR